MSRPAVRIILAPLNNRDKVIRERGMVVDGKALGRTIWLDPRSPNIVDTIVHELTHVAHPSWSESDVEGYTKKRMAKMGWREKARLLKLLGHALIEGEKSG